MTSTLPLEAISLLKQLGDAHALLMAENATLKTLGAPQKLRAKISAYRNTPESFVKQAHQDEASARAAHSTIITWGDEIYPKALKEIVEPPTLIFAKGHLEHLNAPHLAIVGSRKATPQGVEIAFDLACQLAERGLHIISGMAYGVDAAAHKGAMHATQGSTTAVLGTGIDVVYPHSNTPLRDHIVEKGLLLSEFPARTPPKPENFPKRNRIISGMSVGVLLVEAATRSGSLITARLAREQNREVFAVPGSIYNPLNKGCHALIRSGAKLVETAEDVLEEISGQFKPHSISASTHNHVKTGAKPQLSAQLRILLEAVGYEPTSADLAIARARLDATTVATGLVTLELQGLIKATPFGYVRARHF